MKKIIVPIDFSECSVEALRVAADVAKSTNATVVLVHWYYRPYSASLSPIFSQVTAKRDVKADEQYKSEVKENFDKLIKQSFMKGVNHAQLLVFDKSTSEVFEMKEITSADLIIMGTKGADNVKELTVGSNTQKAVRNASCPVLAVKKYFDVTKISDIIFASDFNEDEAVSGYKKVDGLLKMTKAKLHLLKVITPTYFEDTDTSKSKMEAFSSKTKTKDAIHSIYNNYSAEEGISDYANKFKSPLICMATHGYKGFGHFINGSVAEDLVNRLDKPILTVKM